MFPLKLGILDMRQGGDMTFLHVSNKVEYFGHETGWLHDLSSCFFIKLVVLDMKQGGNMTYLHASIKLVDLDTKQGGNLTYLHALNHVG